MVVEKKKAVPRAKRATKAVVIHEDTVEDAPAPEAAPVVRSGRGAKKAVAVVAVEEEEAKENVPVAKKAPVKRAAKKVVEPAAMDEAAAVAPVGRSMRTRR